MRRIPSYLVMALLGLAFISAGLITMFADTSEVVPTDDSAGLLPTATFTLTPPPTATVYIPPPTIVPPTVVIPTAIPTLVDVQPLPTEVVVDLPTAVPTEVMAAAPLEPTVETPVTNDPIPPTVEETTGGEVAPQDVPVTEAGVPAVEESPTVEVTLAETPTVDPAAGGTNGEVGAVGASEDDPSTSPITDVNSASPAPTIETTPAEGVEITPPPLEVTANGADAPQPNAPGGEGAAPVAPTTDPAVAPPIVPTTDPAVAPPVVPTTDPAVVPPVVPTTDPALAATVIPTSDPALAPTTDSALLPTAEDATSVGEPEVAASPVPAQIFGVVTFADVQDHTGIVITLTMPDGTTMDVATDAAGTFTFQNLPPGNYRVIASSSGYLSRQADFGLGEGQVVTLPPTSLPVGDTNLDNIIDLTDAALIASNFDTPATVPEADINNDGWIDVKDLALVGADYGQTGPLPWQ